MINAMLRVYTRIKPDGATPHWVHFVNEAVPFEVPPLPKDVIIIAGAEGFVLTEVGPNSFTSALSPNGASVSVRVDERFFTPTGQLVLNALLPYHLHQREDDPVDIDPAEVWDRLNGEMIALTLSWAGYEPHEITRPAKSEDQ